MGWGCAMRSNRRRQSATEMIRVATKRAALGSTLDRSRNIFRSEGIGTSGTPAAAKSGQD